MDFVKKMSGEIFSKPLNPGPDYSRDIVLSGVRIVGLGLYKDSASRTWDLENSTNNCTSFIPFNVFFLFIHFVHIRTTTVLRQKSEKFFLYIATQQLESPRLSSLEAANKNKLLITHRKMMTFLMAPPFRYLLFARCSFLHFWNSRVSCTAFCPLTCTTFLS